MRDTPGIYPSPHIPPSGYNHPLRTSMLLLLLFVSFPIHPCSSSSSLSFLQQWPMSIWRTMGFLGFILLLLGPLRLSIITWWPATGAPIVNYSCRGLEPLRGLICPSISHLLMVSNWEQAGCKVECSQQELRRLWWLQHAVGAEINKTSPLVSDGECQDSSSCSSTSKGKSHCFHEANMGACS